MAPAASTKPADTLRVPAAMLPLVEPMNRWIDAFCDACLDEEYAYLSKKMLAKLARKRPSPLERGDPVIWAASVVYTVGRVNFLDDPTQTPHLTLDQFSEASEVTKSSLSRKSRVIAEAIDTREPGFRDAPVDLAGEIDDLIRLAHHLFHPSPPPSWIASGPATHNTRQASGW